MSRLLGAILALSLMGGSAAVAGPYDHGGSGYGVTSGYSHGDRGRGWYAHRDHGNNDGAAIAAGVGILALIAILASKDRHDDQQGAYDRNGDQQYGASDDGYRGEPDGRYAPGQMHQ